MPLSLEWDSFNVMLGLAIVTSFVGDKLNKSLRQDIDKYVTED